MSNARRHERFPDPVGHRRLARCGHDHSCPPDRRNTSGAATQPGRMDAPGLRGAGSRRSRTSSKGDWCGWRCEPFVAGSRDPGPWSGASGGDGGKPASQRLNPLSSSSSCESSSSQPSSRSHPRDGFGRGWRAWGPHAPGGRQFLHEAKRTVNLVRPVEPPRCSGVERRGIET